MNTTLLPIESVVAETGTLRTVQGAVARTGPTREAEVVRVLSAGERLATDGFTDQGQNVLGSARWYRLAADGSWVHSSGGAHIPQGIGRLPLSAIWGSTDLNWDEIQPALTQEHGITLFSQQHPEFYEYSLAYCRSWCPNANSDANCGIGHPGLDVGVPFGTPLVTPAAGVVVCAGTGVGSPPFSPGCGFFRCQPPSGAAQSGRLEIELENGDRLIYGHMSRVEVEPGQLLAAGDRVGLSGRDNGDHVHIEYRQRASACTADVPFRLVDPRDMFP
jgi:murein DD-endopeptidase MepM/ murein hydrolase activator NlpD